MKRKLLSIITVLAMLCTMVSPASVFADEGEETAYTGIVSSQYTADEETGYLTFSSDSQFSIGLGDVDAGTWDGQTPWDGSIWYTMEEPTETTQWKEWDGSEITSEVPESGGKCGIYFRGTGNGRISSDYNDDSGYWHPYSWKIQMKDSESQDGVNCYGNLETLLDYETVLAGEHPEMREGCFTYMFYDCDRLLNIPDMPATDLTVDCYYMMFYDCDAITSVPDISIAEAGEQAMRSMFYGCDSIVSVGNITVGYAGECALGYAFYGCEAIKEIGSIAVGKAQECALYETFYESGASADVGDIDIDYAGYRACACMFQYADLNTVGSITIDTAKGYACGYMFDNAVAKSVKDIRVGYADYCAFYYMFSNGDFGSFGDIIIGDAEYCACKYMFCNSYFDELGDISIDAVGEYCCYGMFGCAGSDSEEGATVGDLTLGDVEVYGCGYMFTESYIKEAGNITAVNVEYEGFEHAFSSSRVEKVGSIQVGKAGYCAFHYMFAGCMNLKEIPSVDAEEMGAWACSGMFYLCIGLGSAPALPCTDLLEGAYYYMFGQCRSLKLAPELPAEVAAESCYEEMFSDCVSLEMVPEIGAQKVYEGAFKKMFYGCRSLQIYTSPQEGYTAEWSIGDEAKAPTGGCQDWNLEMFEGTASDIGELEFGKTYYVKKSGIISFEENGGSPISNMTIGWGWHFDEDSVVTQRKGYVFDGWYKDAALTEKYDADSEYVIENIRLYAAWKECQDIAGAELALSDSKLVYTGENLQPAVEAVTLDGVSLDAAGDYDVAIEESKRVGSYTVTVTGKGSYKGTATAGYTIVPQQAAVQKTAAGSKKLTVTMSSKVSATGGSKYQVQYRVKGAKSWKNKYTSGKTLTIKSLKKGKKYQVRVRAYKTVNDRTYYGAWSAVNTSGKIK